MGFAGILQKLVLVPIFAMNCFIFFYIFMDKDIQAVLNKSLSFEWNQTNKNSLILIVSTLFAILYLAHTFWAIILRFLTFSPNPSDQTDPKVIILCNRMQRNLLDSGAIFLPIFATWTLLFSSPEDKGMIVGCAFFYILSRVFYVFGYSFSTISVRLGSLRSLGFTLNMMVVFYMIFRITPNLITLGKAVEPIVVEIAKTLQKKFM